MIFKPFWSEIGYRKIPIMSLGLMFVQNTILTILVLNRVRYVHSDLELSTVLRRSYLYINVLPVSGAI